jgi:hypothetical protein
MRVLALHKQKQTPAVARSVLPSPICAASQYPPAFPVSPCRDSLPALLTTCNRSCLARALRPARAHAPRPSNVRHIRQHRHDRSNYFPLRDITLIASRTQHPCRRRLAYLARRAPPHLGTRASPRTCSPRLRWPAQARVEAGEWMRGGGAETWCLGRRRDGDVVRVGYNRYG